MDRIVKAFFNSAAGLAHACRRELAVQQEVVVLLVALPVCLFVTENWWKRLALIGVLLIVLMAELLNTAIEALADHVTPEHHPHIRIVKDLGSAAVFMALTLAGLTWILALAERLV
ncbi:diacylglycerol kinase [Labrys monachus]|uniref:Diacylglycerol kinase n=1 Tax=Labrys monachus TaxID=217067 RepID=A0ABU0FI31_9HYPH|nr:diacylglycerol kinase [Labrys monachus]MDQ0394268.1 diacylglycerol kinase (ATP) [Labrys monachus]